MTARRLVGSFFAGLLLVTSAAACDRFGPHLNVDVDNTGGRSDVTVTVDSSAPNPRPGGDEVTVDARVGAAWSVPLGTTWEVRVDRRHVVGSDDRPDLALPSDGRRQDVTVTIRVEPDGTVKLVGACLEEDYVDGRCVAP